MSDSFGKIGLTSLDDLFKTDQERQQDKLERVLTVPADQVFPYARQPYSVDRPTPDLARLMDSIERSGIAEPMIVRPRAEGGYEIISGHRRDYCARELGLDTRPVIVREYSDEEADILVVDANINREDLLPSEKAARAYKLKLDAMKRQAGRPSQENGNQLGPHLFRGKSKELLSEQVGESTTQIQRYVNLTRLIPTFMDLVDSGRLKFVPAADYLSHLSEQEQTMLLEIMERDEVSPSMDQAKRLKGCSMEGHLDDKTMNAIMGEEKPLERKVTLHSDKLERFFPKNYTPRQMEQVILQLLEGWYRRRQQDRER